jgi:hypothetical protein
MEQMYTYKDQARSLWDEHVVDSKGYQYVDMWSSKFLTGVVYAGSVFGAAITPRQVGPRDNCPGYAVSNVQQTPTGLTADLSLAGTACNVFGNDVRDLKLLVNYDAGIYSFPSHDFRTLVY